MEPKYLPVKDTTEIIPLSWTFQDPTVVILNATCTVSVESGTDATPSAILYSSPILQNNNQVIQVITGGLDGVTYKIVMTCTLLDNTIPVFVAYLPVQAT